MQIQWKWINLMTIRINLYYIIIIIIPTYIIHRYKTAKYYVHHNQINVKETIIPLDTKKKNVNKYLK